jgi:hypothetical protein
MKTLVIALVAMAAIGAYLITHGHETGGWWIVGLSFFFLAATEWKA